jgi:hypothetical protein
VPATLASESPSRPEEIVVDADAIYWAESGVVRRRAKTAGAVETLVAASPDQMAVDDQYLYWVNRAGGVGRVLKTGGQAFTVAADMACGGSCEEHRLAVDQDAVYWTNELDLLVAPKAGGAPVVLERPIADLQIAVDNDNVYWNKLDYTSGSVTYSLEATPKVGGNSRTLASFDDRWAGPYVVNNGVVIVQAQALWRIPTDGSEPQQIASGPFTALAVATDGTNIDLLQSTQIVTVDPAGEMRTLACLGDEGIRKLASDADNVYWTDADTGTINYVTR